MTGSPLENRPLWGVGITSFVLGTVGLLLFGLPILGAPISSLGFICGLAGCIAGRVVHTSTFRWSVAGLALSVLALSTDLVMQYSPRIGVPVRKMPTMLREVSGRPDIPPPSRWIDE